MPDKGRSGKQKTGVVRRSGGSPVWNHTFIYKDVSLQELAERGLELTVWDHDRIASNEFLGGVRFNLGTGKFLEKDNNGSTNCFPTIKNLKLAHQHSGTSTAYASSER